MHIALHVLARGGDAGELSEPLRPEHERGGRAEREDDDERHLPHLGEGDEGGPLRHEHAERRDEHAQDAEHHEARKARHALEEQVHVLDIAAADVVLCGAHAQEQKRLGDGVEQDEERRRPDGLGGADAGAGDDQAEVGDGRVREHALGVGLRDGHERAERERDAAHEHRHDGGHRREQPALRGEGAGVHDGRELDEQEHARLDHGRGMQKRRGGRRRHHGTEEPCVEGHLRGLREPGEGERRDRQRDEGGVLNADLQELEQRQRAQLDGADVQCAEEGDAADEVHDDLTEGVSHGLLGAGVADEEERAHRGDLPAGEQPHHVVREHDEEHRREEGEHEGEEHRAAILRAFGLVGLEVLHVAEGVHADARADDADDERHEQRQRVEVEPLRDGQAVGERELEHERARHLDGGEHAGRHVLMTDAEEEDGRGDEHAHDHADVVDRGRVEIEGDPRGAQVGDDQPYRSDPDDERRGHDDGVSHAVVAHREQHARHDEREEDQKAEQSHGASSFVLSDADEQKATQCRLISTLSEKRDRSSGQREAGDIAR